MKLGIDGREFQNAGRTGIGRYLADFIEWTAANRPDIDIAVFMNQRCRYTPPGPRVSEVIIKEDITQIWDQILLPRAIKSNNIDVFLSPYFKMPMLAPCPVVLVVNDLIPLRLPASLSGSAALTNAYFRATAFAALRRAARIISISEFSKQDVAREFGIPPGSITVAPLGISDELAPVRDAETIRITAARYGIKKPYILYVGQLRASKNVDSLIRAYASLQDNFKNEYTLAIGGQKTGEYSRLVKLSKELGADEKIDFLGFVDDGSLAALLSGAALFVYPSLYEGFGFPPLEAMACGAPVVCSAASSLAEVIGEAALAVDPPDAKNIAAAIERVLSDCALRESLALKGIERAREFTIERMSRGFLSVIENV
ncbi:MAG: glycosyltransferase family 1 protein [bacterium]